MVLGAPLWEGAEVERLLVVLMEEEEGPLGLGAVAVWDRHHLSDSVWLSLALIFAGFGDVVCTNVVVAPARNNHKDIRQTKDDFD